MLILLYFYIVSQRISAVSVPDLFHIDLVFKTIDFRTAYHGRVLRGCGTESVRNTIIRF